MALDDAPEIVIKVYNLLLADETFYDRWIDGNDNSTSLRFANIPESTSCYVKLDPDFDFY